jgi:hypothetical protein
MSRPDVVAIFDLSNEEFLARYAAPGRVGLAGGSHAVSKAIRKMAGRCRPDRSSSAWSHAFVFGGRRVDGHHWVIESDLDVKRKSIRLGVQENRVLKYADAREYPNLAVLDFGLDDDQVLGVLTAALDLLARQAHYSVRELAGTMLALHGKKLRPKKNVLAREGALYCSAMVQHCYEAIGLDFAADVHLKNTTPEDIANTPIPHTTWILRKPTRKKLAFSMGA